MKSEITYELTTEIEYHHKGTAEKASFITLNAPTSRNAAECVFLKQAFMRSLPTDDGSEEKEDKEKKETANPTGSEVMALLYMSENCEMGGVVGHARKLLISGVALVDGEEKLTAPLLDKVSQEDFESMIGEYLINFILASALQKTNEI